MIKLVMAGAAGRMGQSILNLAYADKKIKVVGGLEATKNPVIGKDIGEFLGLGKKGVSFSSKTESVLSSADVIIDFTHASVVSKNVKAALKTKTSMVIGTTGLTSKVQQEIKNASKKIPIVFSPNMSVGVNLLFKLSELTATILDDDYDIEISEIHHKMKKDSPSGTAVKLLEIVSAARKKNIKKNTVYGREGEVGARPRGEIGVFAQRGGDVVGDHNVQFFGDGERIELIHKASSRNAFGRGALLAAKFLAKKKKGLFSMQDVLGMS